MRRLRAGVEAVRRLVRRVLGGLSRGIYHMVLHLPIFLFGAVGLYYTLWLFARLDEDTTRITNTAFGIVATLSALSFSCSRAIEGPPEAKDRFAYSGERFLHAAQMALTASALKYGLVLLGIHDLEGSPPLPALVANKIVGLLVVVLFMYAFFSAHGGMIVLNRLLWQRLNRYPYWDRFF